MTTRETAREKRHKDNDDYKRSERREKDNDNDKRGERKTTMSMIEERER